MTDPQPFHDLVAAARAEVERCHYCGGTGTIEEAGEPGELFTEPCPTCGALHVALASIPAEFDERKEVEGPDRRIVLTTPWEPAND